MIQSIISFFVKAHEFIEKNPVTIPIVISFCIWLMKKINDLFVRYILRNSARKIGLPAFESRSIFHFGSQRTHLYGRDSELKQLQEFCSRKLIALNDEYKYDKPHPVLWWMVSGEGGSGKSKLCYHFLKKMRRRGWTVCMPLRSAEGHRKETLEEASKYLPNKTIFLIDYAEYDTHVVNEWIKGLVNKKQKNNKRIRIILIQRREKEGFGSFPKELCYANPLELKASLSIEALDKIIKDFAKKELKYKLKDDQSNRILDNLSKVDSNLLRPLFAIILTSAEKDGVPITSKEQALSYIFNHEKERYAGELRNIGFNCDWSGEKSDNIVLFTLMSIITFATITGSLKLDTVGTRLLPEPYRKSAIRLNNSLVPKEGHPTSARKEIELLEWRRGNSYVECRALEPDVIGEFFVLAWLKELDESIVKELISAAWSKAYFTIRFINRLFQDYLEEKWIFDRRYQSLFSVVELPSCISKIKRFEFARFAQITELTIPGNIKEIEESAFLGCRSLVKVKIKSGLESIGIGAFEQCTSLRIFHMPDTVCSVGQGAFFGCGVLSDFKCSRNIRNEIDKFYLAPSYSKQYGGHEWSKLDLKEDGRLQVLLVSKYVLDRIMFDSSIKEDDWNSSRGKTSYSDSTIRTRILDKFAAFLGFDNDTARYVNKIELEKSINSRWGTTWGDPRTSITDKKDGFWLLSCEEADKYFPDHDRVTTADGQPSDWWLRTCGINDHFACVVDTDGHIDYNGLQINKTAGLRPAMWINIDQD